MYSALLKRIPWLSSSHPLTHREQTRIRRDLPVFFHKLTDFWTSLGYAALIHGAFFIFALITYNRVSATLPVLLMPFLTPFGTPIGVGILHSLLYWAMMIGICNQTTYLIARDFETHTWATLRATPYTSAVIIAAKLRVVGGVWMKVVKALIVTRSIAVLIIPLAIYLQRQSTSEGRMVAAFDPICAATFLAQPLVDAMLVASLSVLSALLIRSTTWAKIGAYGLSAVVYGAIMALGGFWMLWRTPIGGLAGLLVPLGHWGPLAAAVVPIAPAEFSERTLVIVSIYFVLPLLTTLIIGLCIHRLARRMA